MDVSPGNGIVKVGEIVSSSYPATYSFEDGTTVLLEAVPASGYLFTSWSGDLSGTTNPATIVIECNNSITANFSQIATSQVNWPLVSGIIGGLVLVGLPVIILIVRQKVL